MQYMMLMWPGFARAWWRGEIYGVALATLFSVCFNIAWFGTFIWPNWFPGVLTNLLWLALFTAAMCSLVINLMRWQSLFGEKPVSVGKQKADQAFRSAQKAYLRGEYFEAEAALHPIFVSGREDVESALLLAGILRRTNRVEQAVSTLERLCRLESSAFWQHEIHRERLLCEKASQSQTDQAP